MSVYDQVVDTVRATAEMLIALGTAASLWIGHKNKKGIDDIKHATDGLTERLVAGAHREGVTAGKEEEKEKQQVANGTTEPS